AGRYRDEGAKRQTIQPERGQGVGGPPAQPHQRSGQAGQHRAQRDRQTNRDERPWPATTSGQKKYQKKYKCSSTASAEVVEVGEGPLPLLGDVDVDGVEPRPSLAVREAVERRPRSSGISGTTKKT